MSQEIMLRPPLNRSMRVLDRSLFSTSLLTSAARIFNNHHIATCRKDLEKSQDLLILDKLNVVRPDPNSALANQGRRCLLLRPEIKHDDKSTWSELLRRLHDTKTLEVIPYELKLDYDVWSYHDIMTAVLPESEQDEIPSGFAIVGHVAHLNLRHQYLPYKSLIAQVILDKNPQLRTVINKVDDVGAENEYRTFSYEVLAGPDDLNVEIKEEDCIFAFDYAKVYWNSRLHHEHKRIVEQFNEGDAVCDVMAGVGPFALPAGRKKIFVWANDLNPDSHASLVAGTIRNKVSDYVRPFNADGRTFIVDATRQLYQATNARRVDIKTKPSRSSKQPAKVIKTITEPRFFKHFVMNLPASALTFLPSFIGLYDAAGIPEAADTPLPTIHVHCFSTKSDDNVQEGKEICAEITSLLKREMRPGRADVEGEVLITDVRDVAPNKRMFCASFLLPKDVAWRAR